MWTHKGKYWLVPKYEGYDIMVSAFCLDGLASGIHSQFHISKPLMNITLSTIIMLIKTSHLTSWDILTRNPSPSGEILSANNVNMVQVSRYIVPMTGSSYNFRNTPISLRLFILVLILSLYYIIYEVMIE